MLGFQMILKWHTFTSDALGLGIPHPQPIIDEETGPQRLNLPNISKFHSQNLTPSLQASKLLLKNEESVKTKIDFHLMKVMTISIMSTSYYS